jgi:CHAT domain-containing protein
LQSAVRSAKDSNISFERLPFTRQEAEQILSLVSPSDRKQAFDFTASRTTASSKDLSQYRIIHFATHGILNSKHPELSGKIFYNKMLKAGLKPAAALQAAQLEIWRTQEYAAPYYWAAFTLQGEWR